MSNYAFTSVCIKGDRKELKKLYEIMVQLEKNEKPLVENGFHDCNRWLGNLVHFLGGDYQAIDCRGTWSNLHLGNDCLCFDCETAWNAPFEVLKLIEDSLSEGHVYYETEGDDWDMFLTNDAEGIFFNHHFVLDTHLEYEYYNSIEEVSKRLSVYLGHDVEPSKTTIYDAIDEWETNNSDNHKYIILKEFRVIDSKPRILI